MSSIARAVRLHDEAARVLPGNEYDVFLDRRVIELSENVKLRFDLSQGKVTLPADAVPAPDPAQMDDAEAQMRRALGLNGGVPRPRLEQERSEQPMMPRQADRFAPAQRRRFVQDGDVPVTVVRREPMTDSSAARQSLGGGIAAGLAGPTSSRLQRAEAALAAEIQTRDRLERSLADAQALIRDLQTKIGHAELTKAEVLEQVRQEKEGHAGLRASMQEQSALRQEAEDRARAAERQMAALHSELTEERSARKQAEKALHAAEEARESAERLVQVLSAEATPAAAATPKPARGRAASPAVARPGRAAQTTTAEPEPVKWWLPQATPSKRR